MGVEAKVTSASATPGHSVTQRDRSCAGKTTERGTETGLIDCREAVITNVARFRAPADILCESGGIGSVAGAVMGAFIMASLDNGMSMMDVPTFWQYIVKGAILLLAVWMDSATKRRA